MTNEDKTAVLTAMHGGKWEYDPRAMNWGRWNAVGFKEASCLDPDSSEGEIDMQEWLMEHHVDYTSIPYYPNGNEDDPCSWWSMMYHLTRSERREELAKAVIAVAKGEKDGQ